jgi:nucleotide-binding universal stress UspA family protein
MGEQHNEPFQLSFNSSFEANHVELLVTATAGRTGLSHLVLGSSAERVVRTACCPVLTMRPHA